MALLVLVYSLMNIIVAIKLSSTKLLLLVTALALLSCNRTSPATIIYPDHNFNSISWKQDSSGCLNYREKTCASLAKNSEFFNGKSYKYVLGLLGKPSFPYKTGNPYGTAAYVIECTEIALPNQNSQNIGGAKKNHKNDTALLLFHMQQDVCVNVSIAEP